MIQNFLNMGKETNMEVQKVQKAPNRMNPWRSTPRHSLIKKMSNLKLKREF